MPAKKPPSKPAVRKPLKATYKDGPINARLAGAAAAADEERSPFTVVAPARGIEVKDTKITVVKPDPKGKLKAKKVDPKVVRDEIDLEADAGVTVAPEDALARIAELANEIIRLEVEAERRADALKETQEELRTLTEETLPTLMESCGVKDFTLADGSKVTISDVIRASLPTDSAIAKEKDKDKQFEMRDRRAKCLAYIEAMGAGSMIKHYLEAELGKGADALAKKVLDTLSKMGVKAAASKGVHAQTLQAWIKERIRAGLPLDYDLFKVFNGRKAEIKAAKPTKAKAQ